RHLLGPSGERTAWTERSRALVRARTRSALCARAFRRCERASRRPGRETIAPPARRETWLVTYQVLLICQGRGTAGQGTGSLVRARPHAAGKDDHVLQGIPAEAVVGMAAMGMFVHQSGLFKHFHVIGDRGLRSGDDLRQFTYRAFPLRQELQDG